MAKKISRLEDLTPDSNNFNKHTEFGNKLLEDSLRKFGAGRSILTDKDGNIIAGNGVTEVAAAIGMEDVEVVHTDGKKLVVVVRDDLELDSPEGRELALADNMTALKGIDLDLDKVTEALGEDIAKAWGMNLNIEELTEEEEIARKEQEFRERMAAGEITEEDEEYQEFLDKFKLKKTTDDCYTPDMVYDAVASWVMSRYDVKLKDFVRPFYPGGDYKSYVYTKNSIVVDNPPFSILAEILQFYKQRNVKFFLFAPTLTLFSSASSNGATALCCGASITYANGAGVNTSFITNMEDPSIRFKSEPSLYNVVQKANDDNLKQTKRELPKYTYPDNILTSTFVARLSKYGVDYCVKCEESEPISQLDSQKEQGKAIYGKGYIVSDKMAQEKAAAEKAAAEKAAAEKAAATRWALSQREKDIIKRLSQDN